MTVTTILDRQEFDGDGSNKVFPFNFKFFKNSDIWVYVTGPDGQAIGKTLNVDYTLSGAGNASGGSVLFTVAPVADSKVLVRRIVKPTQETSFRNQAAFFPIIHEDAFDRLTMLIQQIEGGDGVNSLQRTPDGMSWDFLGMRGFNAADPVIDTDVATAGWVRGIAAAGAQYTAPGDGAVPQSVQARLRKVVYPEDFGAVGDGVTNDTQAINRAIASLYPVEGTPGKTYAVSGRITYTGPLFRLKGLRFKQLSPSPSDIRTIFYQGNGRVELEGLVIDKNGTGTGGALNDSAGIWIAGATSGYVKNCEVFGNDFGNGIAIIDCTGRFLVANNNVHDLRGGTSSSAVKTDDTIQGIWCQRSSVILVENTISNLSNVWTGQAQTPRFTRGIALGGCFDYFIGENYVNNVDQAIDSSGGEVNRRGIYIGNSLNNAYTWGLKFANTGFDILVLGNKIYRPGCAGIVVSAPTSDIGADAANITRRISIFDNDIDDPGFGGNWDNFEQIGPCGILILNNPILYPNDPRGIKMRDNKIQAASGKMKFGIYNRTNPTAVPRDWNEGLGNIIDDATNSATNNLGLPFAKRKSTTNQNTAAGVNLELDLPITQDPGLMVTDSKSFKVPRTGIYSVEGTVRINSSATGYITVSILLDGALGDRATTGDGVVQFPPNANTSESRLYQVKMTAALVAGQRVSLQVNTLTVASSVVGASLTMMQIPGLG